MRLLAPAALLVGACLVLSCASCSSESPAVGGSSAEPTLAPLPGDVRTVTLPPGVCAPDAPQVTLVAGKASSSAPSLAGDHGGTSFDVDLGAEPATDRGDLDGDGWDDLALAVQCVSLGGGNDSDSHVVVLGRTATGLRLLADVRVTTPAAKAMATAVTLEDGRLSSVNAVQRPEDSNCCPTGTGSSSWVWRAGGVVPGA